MQHDAEQGLRPLTAAAASRSCRRSSSTFMTEMLMPAMSTEVRNVPAHALTTSTCPPGARMSNAYDAIVAMEYHFTVHLCKGHAHCNQKCTCPCSYHRRLTMISVTWRQIASLRSAMTAYADRTGTGPTAACRLLLSQPAWSWLDISRNLILCRCTHCISYEYFSNAVGLPGCLWHLCEASCVRCYSALSLIHAQVA